METSLSEPFCWPGEHEGDWSVELPALLIAHLEALVADEPSIRPAPGRATRLRHRLQEPRCWHP